MYEVSFFAFKGVIAQCGSLLGFSSWFKKKGEGGRGRN